MTEGGQEDARQEPPASGTLKITSKRRIILVKQSLAFKRRPLTGDPWIGPINTHRLGWL
jgi:hypothetical protein